MKARRRSRFQGSKWRLAAAATGIAIALLACETALRVAGFDRHYVNPQASFHQPDPRFGYIGKPNFSARFHAPDFNVRVEHNAQGFRRHVYGAPAADDRPALYVLGDSFTWGWGVDQGQVYTDLIAKKAGDAFSVHNYGLSGTGTVQHAAIFDAYVRDRLKPGDTVLVAFFSNDFPDNLNAPLRGIVEDGRVRILEARIEPYRPIKNWLKEHCLTFNIAAYAIDFTVLKLNRQRETARWRAEAQTQRRPSISDDSPQYLVTREVLRRLRNDCEDRGGRFVAAFLPGHAEVGEAQPDDAQSLSNQVACREAFFRLAAELNLETLDLLADFQEAKRAGCGRTTYPRDVHWNEVGHAIAAEAIAGALTRRSYAVRQRRPLTDDPNAILLVSESSDRVEPRGFPGRIEPEHDADRDGDDDGGRDRQ